MTKGMIDTNMRPVDRNGDILPVLTNSELLTGARAVGELAGNRLNLLTGDWWENPARGNEIVELLKESRMTEADGQALSTYLSSYVQQTAGVERVTDEQWTIDGRRYSWSCRLETGDGNAEVRFEF